MVAIVRGTMRRRAFLGSAGTVAIAGCLEFVQSSGDEGNIGMSSDSFRPEEYRISAGETVTWANTSSKAHTVTAFEEAIPAEAEYFASGDYESQSAAGDAWFDHFGGGIDAGETYTHTFEVVGEYDYYCIPHLAANMVGRIIVE